MASRLPAGTIVQANGISLNLVDTGGDGEAVVLLHGFPNDATLFRHQIPPLAQAGYRAIAIDLRGYGESDRPKDVSTYEIRNLVKDVEGVMDALNVRTAHIVGHDWGALLAWAFAGYAKERTKSLVAISVGHPGCFFKGEHGFTQRRLSWYMLLFQFPGVADRAFLSGGAIFPPMAPTEGAQQDYARMFEMLARPESDAQAAAVTAGINWYRANIKPEAFTTDKIMDLPNVSCNTLVLWPTGDEPFLVEECPKQSGTFVDSPGTFRYERIESPTHFPSWDAPEATNAALLKFLKSQEGK